MSEPDESITAAVGTCEERITEAPWHFHSHPCSRQARFEVVRGDERLRVCGTHKRSLVNHGWTEDPT